MTLDWLSVENCLLRACCWRAASHFDAKSDRASEDGGWQDSVQSLGHLLKCLFQVNPSGITSADPSPRETGFARRQSIRTREQSTNAHRENPKCTPKQIAVTAGVSSTPHQNARDSCYQASRCWGYLVSPVAISNQVVWLLDEPSVAKFWVRKGRSSPSCGVCF